MPVPLHNRFVVNVEAAVVRSDGRYLMTMRSPQKAHAPNTLCMPGGKVEDAGTADGVLENHLRREIMEETSITVEEAMYYVESKSFVSDDGVPVVDVVFLCRYKSGEPAITQPHEVAAIDWLTEEEIASHPRVGPWTVQSIRLADALRRRLW